MKDHSRRQGKPSNSQDAVTSTNKPIVFVAAFITGYIAGKLKSKEENILGSLNNNDFTFWTRDVRTGKVTVSEGNAQIYGVSRKDFERNPNIFFDSIHPDDVSILLDAMEEQKAAKKTTVVYRIIRLDGSIRWVEDRGTPIFNKKGEMIKVKGVIFDITSQKKAEEKINELAFQDALTGLPNRNWFQDHLLATIKRKSPVAVMFIDFDNFKRVNDTLGHRAGDHLLIQIAKRLRACIRKKDIVSRQSGDEFLVLVHSDNVSEIEETAKYIIQEMNHPYTVDGTEILSTPSIGISLFPQSADNAESLIEMADFAMYLAKKSGKNTYQFYNEELNRQMKRKVLLETRLHKAISQGELEVYYQPQIDLSTGCLAGAEALLRWECDMGKIPPDEFIAIAEDTGSIIQIGEWVIREACRHYKRFKDHGLAGFPISVNISTKQLMHQNIVERIKAILVEEDTDPRSLTLEITESALLFYEDAKNNLMELRKLGVGISLDDFGVGYSSLSMIKNIDIDELKIDKSFLNDALDNKRVRALLETIVLIGKKIEAKVVIEGIETAEEMEFLMKLGVYGQGYFYSKPLPIDDFEKWYHTFYR
ncbi:putative bifunctional diguanylate cyclase/phosphodiesterase [Oceanobacillus damuensis]|uniref:putative bifunctional diguanylate cyclase/phosphodiesterase n=1 Tax=Oceanobacillus damuensis TaxID=937928 RepID=UPI00082EE167|nr:GGDEF domain-containing phosphodiesterase [Oceanobacillus damuensis]